MPYEKVGKNEPVCIADEVPFEIPNSWEWARVENITLLYNGRAFKPTDWTETGLPIVRIQNLNDPNAPFNRYDKSVEDDYHLYGGELLFAWSGTPGTSFGAHIWRNEEAVLNQHIFRLEFDEESLYKPYLMHALNERVGSLIKAAHGSAGLQHVTRGVFEATFIPIPPYKEQIRIVEKIDAVLPCVNEYSLKESKLSELNTSFPDLLKKSILQQAVMGKLVPHDPNDEPASVLLERIRTEKDVLIKAGKLKKDKHESIIYRRDNSHYEKVNGQEVCIDDEIPFEIPDTWEWVRLGSLMKVISDGTHKTPNYVKYGIPFLSVQNISKGYFDLSRIKYITHEEHEKLIQRVKPEKNDILICRIGTLGKAIKCSVDFEFSIFVSLGLLRPVVYDLSDYIVLAINSPLGDKWIQENKVGGGTHTYKINLVDLPKMLIPLPPLEEQKHIVESCLSIMPIINTL